MKQQSITALPLAPDLERHRRAVKYTIAMSIRVLCLLSLLFVHGWWVLIPAAGAIFLPYFAVVIANVSGSPPAEVQRPGNVVRAEPDTADGGTTASGSGSEGATSEQERRE